MKKAGLVSAWVYTGLSLVVAAAFLLATLAGQYTLVERLGGTIWVFILSMIILMPLVTPLVRKRIAAAS